MLYLLGDIIASSMSNLVFAEAARRRLDGQRILLYNYLVAALLSALLLWRGGMPPAPPGRAGGLLPACLQSQEGQFVFWCAVASGWIYLAAYLVNQRGVTLCGPSMTTLFSKLGVLLSSIAAFLFWDEQPTACSVLGIGLSFAALLLFCFSRERTRFSAILPAVFLLGGAVELSKKIYTEYAGSAYQNIFYLITFSLCLLLCLALLALRGKLLVFRWGEAALGAGMGLSNFCATFCTMEALKRLPASFFFPALSGSVIALTAVVGAVRFRERLGPRRWFALALTIAALILMRL